MWRRCAWKFFSAIIQFMAMSRVNKLNCFIFSFFSFSLVTGSNSGIGYAIASAFLENGIKVVGLDIQIDALKKLKEENKGSEVYPIVCDVTSNDQVEAAFKWIEDNLGGCQILVNNAGILRNNGILEYQKSMREVELNVDLNFTSVVRCSRLAFKSMVEHDRYGYIINICSVCGISVAPIMEGSSGGVYNGTKFAVTATADVMRLELNMMKNRKVRVTNISPGVIGTNLFKDSKMSNQAIHDFTAGPILTAKDISDTVVYLLTTPYTVNINNIIMRATGADL